MTEVSTHLTSENVLFGDSTVYIEIAYIMMVTLDPTGTL